ncbi:zinc-finger of transposase IS204/IS1001/IS1096/IS1165 [Succinivibrio dextrinosolvens]|uniref:transposase family protein n=1 Tax=Succinivibrio dextrinosolvens TaxID=83771 RepID=UPI0008F396C0|nr:transposase family protein [Succinivibrio dextrinosolvens]SFS83290.1 zinc-finger of transposase IS204/IS1001/IS1096/IS1165 [Succinivibrio dextrinosolvens]
MFISLPSGLDCFKQTQCRIQRVNRNDGTKVNPLVRRHDEYELYGVCTQKYEPKVCPRCGAPLHRNGSITTTLRHIPLGDSYSLVEADRPRFRCSSQGCDYSEVGCIPFKAQGHLITEPLRQYTESLLAYGMTLKEVAHITGLHKCVVKDIYKARLEGLYVTVDKDGKKTLIKPEQQARFIGKDEFKLHDGHKYATVILDMESGCILWLQTGKKKQVVYDFIEHVDLEWMCACNYLVTTFFVALTLYLYICYKDSRSLFTYISLFFIALFAGCVTILEADEEEITGA